MMMMMMIITIIIPIIIIIIILCINVLSEQPVANSTNSTTCRHK
jgi:hypothetical protein